MSKDFILFIGVSSCHYEQNISISIDMFNFDVICNSGQEPRSDMRSHWMIMLHTRIFKANYSPLLKFLLWAFFEMNPLNKHWWSSGEVEAGVTRHGCCSTDSQGDRPGETVAS